MTKRPVKNALGRARRRAMLALVLSTGLATGRPARALDVVATPVEATSFQLKDIATARKITVTARTKAAATGGRVIPPARGGDGDPTAAGTGAGGELVVFNAAGGGDGVLVPLPAASWRLLGSLEDLGAIAGPSDLTLIDAVQGYWTRFAAMGDPNGGGAVAWPPYAAGSEPYLHLTSPVAAGAGLRNANCDFWDAIASGGP